MGAGKTIKEGLIKKFNFIKTEHLFFDTAFRYDTQNNLVEHDYQMIFDFYKNLLKAKQVLLVEPLSILLDMYCYGSVYLIAILLL